MCIYMCIYMHIYIHMQFAMDVRAMDVFLGLSFVCLINKCLLICNEQKYVRDFKVSYLSNVATMNSIQ